MEINGLNILIQGRDFFAEVHEGQAAPIVTDVVRGVFHDTLENLPDDRGVGDAETLEILCGVSQSPAVIVYADVQERVQAEIHGTVQPQEAPQT